MMDMQRCKLRIRCNLRNHRAHFFFLVSFSLKYWELTLVESLTLQKEGFYITLIDMCIEVVTLASLYGQ